MSVIRTIRYTAEPADIPDMLARRAALLTAVRAGFPGLLEARLTKTGEGVWSDAWLWASRDAADAAIAAAAGIPEAAAAFAVVQITGEEFADLIDQR